MSARRTVVASTLGICVVLLASSLADAGETHLFKTWKVNRAVDRAIQRNTQLSAFNSKRVAVHKEAFGWKVDKVSLLLGTSQLVYGLFNVRDPQQLFGAGIGALMVFGLSHGLGTAATAHSVRRAARNDTIAYAKENKIPLPSTP